MTNMTNFIPQYFGSKSLFERIFEAALYLFKVNNLNTREMCRICSKLTIKTPKQLLLIHQSPSQ